jgi:hypothetical protein
MLDAAVGRSCTAVATNALQGDLSGKIANAAVVLGRANFYEVEVGASAQADIRIEETVVTVRGFKFEQDLTCAKRRV